MAAHLYRIRVYNDGGRVLHGKDYTLTLDLDTRPGLKQAARDLDDLVVRLAVLDGADDEMVPFYYLAIHDIETDQLLIHWPAKP